MPEYTEPFLLSSKGSTRATAYVFSNKCVTVDGRTHVVWLDAVSETMGRTFDHASGEWSETFHIGSGQDNHATPAITVDGDKHIRIAFGPHARGWNDGRFKYLVSKRPNDISEWDVPIGTTHNFGYRATYACLLHTPQGEDVIVYRGGDYPLSTLFQRTRPLGGWTAAKEIFRQDIEPQYTNYGSTSVCAEDGTLYVACHFYNVGGSDNHATEGDPSRMRSYGVGVLKTKDLGETWASLGGEPVTVPALYHERIAVPPVDADVRIGGLAVDSRGSLWALIFTAGVDNRDILVSRWSCEGWETTDVAGYLPAERYVTGGTMCIDTKDRLHLAVMAVDIKAVEVEAAKVTLGIKAWGQPSSEVFHMVAGPDMQDIQCRQVSSADDTTANWLPSISRGGVFHPVEKPVILYTHGVKGEGCSPPDETEVFCVMLE